MNKIDKSVFYFWRVINSGFSWTGTSLLVATKILFLILSSIVLTSVWLLGILLSFDSSILVKDNVEIILISIVILSYYIMYKLDLKYRSIDVSHPAAGCPVKGTDRLNAFILAVSAILLFVVVIVATVR